MSETINVNINEIIESETRRKKINSLNLKDIIWVTRNGKEFRFTPKEIGNWELTGLTNIDFIMCNACGVC